MNFFYNNRESPTLFLTRKEICSLGKEALNFKLSVRNESGDVILRSARLMTHQHSEVTLASLVTFPEGISERGASHYDIYLSDYAQKRLKKGERVAFSFDNQAVFIQPNSGRRKYEEKQSPL